MKQLSFALSRQSGSLVAAENADEDVRRADFKAMQASLLALCPVWPHGFRSLLSAHPIVTSQSQLSKFRHVHELLSAAITNIVERWWTDEAARFPDRMPLEKHEEEVLRVESRGFLFTIPWLILQSG